MTFKRHRRFIARCIGGLVVATCGYAGPGFDAADSVIIGALLYATAAALLGLLDRRLRSTGPLAATLLAAVDIAALTLLITQLQEPGVALAGAYALIILALGNRWGREPMWYGAVLASGGIVYLALQHPLWSGTPTLPVITFAVMVLVALAGGPRSPARERRPDARQAAAPPAVVETGDGEGMAVKGLRILVGEDDPTYQKLILRILEQHCHRADLVNNGEDVLDAAETTDYDLLILDMQMPRMGGLEAAKLFRFLRPDRQRIPVIVLTADPGQDTSQECADAGVNAFLTKPVQPQQLLQIISQLVINTDHRVTHLPRAAPLHVVSRPSKSGELIDRELLKEVADLSDDPQFIHELLDGFIHDVRLLILKLRQSAQLGDFGLLVDDAHALMGSARSLGAIALAEICDEAIRTAESSRPDSVDQCIARLRSTFDQTSTALTRFLDEQREPRQDNAAG